MKAHKELRWEYNRFRRSKIILPNLNKILYAIQKKNSSAMLMGKINIFTDELRVSKPNALERKICKSVFDKLKFPLLAADKIADEFGIKYVYTYSFGKVIEEEYSGTRIEDDLRFSLVFSYDLGENCTIHYRNERVEVNNAVVDDNGVVYQNRAVVDRVDCGEDVPTLETLGEQA